MSSQDIDIKLILTFIASDLVTTTIVMACAL